MDKKIIIIVACSAIVILLIVAGYFLWSWYAKKVAFEKLQGAGNATDRALQDATKGAIPSINTNPLENKPDINPADAGNPINKIKTNPFE